MRRSLIKQDMSEIHTPFISPRCPWFFHCCIGARDLWTFDLTFDNDYPQINMDRLHVFVIFDNRLQMRAFHGAMARHWVCIVTIKHDLALPKIDLTWKRFTNMIFFLLLRNEGNNDSRLTIKWQIGQALAISSLCLISLQHYGIK